MESSSSENLLLKPLKITIFWPNLRKNGVPTGHVQNKKQVFFTEITKADAKLSSTFYFNKISYVLAELWMFFHIVWCILLKSVIFTHISCERKACRQKWLATWCLWGKRMCITWYLCSSNWDRVIRFCHHNTASSCLHIAVNT